jgi:hypothetical protein
MEIGTEILLARMKDHPEEFINLRNMALGLSDLRWDRLLRDAKEHLPKEDTDALEAGIKQLYIDRFNERVLKTLAGESEQNSPKRPKRPSSTRLKVDTVQVGLTHGACSAVHQSRPKGHPCHS